MFFIIALSVTSSVRLDGSIPLSAIASRTSATIVGDWSCRADRLTDIESGGVFGYRCCRRRASLHAVWSTQRPSGMMSPLSSASGMNSSGGIRPRSGCCQRTSASRPEMRSVSRVTSGW